MSRAMKALTGVIFASALLGISGCDSAGDPCSVANPDMQTQQACRDSGQTDWDQGYPSYGYGVYGY